MAARADAKTVRKAGPRGTGRDRIVSILILLFAVISLPNPLWAADLARPRIEVYKARRELRLFDGEQLLKSYCVALGTNPGPAKQREGDRATPEGTYFICDKNPSSQFFLSLAISYPGPRDAERGLKAGLISNREYDEIVRADALRTIPPWKTSLGGEIFVHGDGSGSDWTHGCIALDNGDIAELYHLVPVMTPITIYP